GRPPRGAEPGEPRRRRQRPRRAGVTAAPLADDTPTALQHYEGPRRTRALVRRWAPWLLVAPWAAWAVVRTLGLEGGAQPLIQAMSLTPYAALTSLLPLSAALLLRRWRVAAVAGVVVVLFAVALLPRALGGPQPDVDGVRITVMTANVYTGLGDARAVVALVRARRVGVLAM